MLFGNSVVSQQPMLVISGNFFNLKDKPLKSHVAFEVLFFGVYQLPVQKSGLGCGVLSVHTAYTRTCLVCASVSRSAVFGG